MKKRHHDQHDPRTQPVTGGPGEGRHHHPDHDDHAFDFHPGRGRAMSGGPRGRRGRPDGPWGAFGGGFDPRGGFPLGGPGFGRGRGRGRRAARGDIRLALLRLLSEEPKHGYQMIQELSERSGGVWNPSPGSIYPTLAALEDEGLVTAEKRDGKRVFELTDAGRETLAASADQPAPWDEVANDADDTLLALRNQLGHVAAATMQVAQAGGAAQVAAAQKILGDTRKRLYLLLAEDLPTDEPGSAPS